jgi:hypothetical protein
MSASLSRSLGVTERPKQRGAGHHGFSWLDGQVVGLIVGFR